MIERMPEEWPLCLALGAIGALRPGPGTELRTDVERQAHKSAKGFKMSDRQSELCAVSKGRR